MAPWKARLFIVWSRSYFTHEETYGSLPALKLVRISLEVNHLVVQFVLVLAK